jgi:hypothetical protein
MTLDEIRAAKIEMEEAIFKAVSAEQAHFEARTKLAVKSIGMSFAHHGYVGGGQKVFLSSVKCEVDPWQ